MPASPHERHESGKTSEASDVSEALSESTNERDEDQERGLWSQKMDFFFSCLSYSVGLGSVWRFPYICYRNGAGTFLIPSILMLVITGIPLLYLELSFGQFAGSGIVGVWNAVPLFQGVGWAMFTVSVLISIYCNMLIAYSLYYLFASFQAKLPWRDCGEWSSEACSSVTSNVIKNCTDNDGKWCLGACIHKSEVNTSVWDSLKDCAVPVPPSDDYFHKVVLDLTEGVNEMGGMKWELALCLLLSWIIVCFCLAKGIKSSGKVAYVTALFPFLVLVLLLIRSLTLPGSSNGLVHFFKPQWHRLGDAKVWGDAAIQIFFSLSLSFGGHITLASHNNFHNNCFFDAVIVSIMVFMTSVLAGLVIFCIIGFMAKELNQPLDSVIADGAGLAFIVYPAVVTKLPVSQLWSVLFFSMLLSLGLGTQMSTVATVHTTLLDQFPQIFRKTQTRRILLLLSICIVSYLAGLIFASQGGIYIMQLFDNYAASYSLLVIGVAESLALSWIYGADRFLIDIESMLGYRPSKIWTWMWRVVAPFVLLGILIFTWIDFKPTEYNKVIFPAWADGVGWLMSCSSIMAIPLAMFYKIVVHKTSRGCSIVMSVKFLCMATPDWGPTKKEHKAERKTLEMSLTENSIPSNVVISSITIDSQTISSSPSVL